MLKITDNGNSSPKLGGNKVLRSRPRAVMFVLVFVNFEATYIHTYIHAYIYFLLRQVGLRQPKGWWGPARNLFKKLFITKTRALSRELSGDRVMPRAEVRARA